MIKEIKKGIKQQLSPHFNSSEFDCKCALSSCTVTRYNTDLIDKLEILRNLVGTSIKINSAYRCEAHNKKIGGEKYSQHMLGNAADIVISNLKPDEVADLCEDFDGLGRYPTFTHVDVRGTKARWDRR